LGDDVRGGGVLHGEPLRGFDALPADAQLRRDLQRQRAQCSAFLVVSTIRSTVGMVASSSSPALGSGTCGVVMRVGGPSRFQKHSSTTIETISAPHPHSRGFSSTVTRRLVLDTESHSVLASSGTRLRTSMTSASIPSEASCPA